MMALGNSLLRPPGSLGPTWLAAEAAAPRSVLPLKPRRIDLGMRFILSVKGWQRKDEDGARARAARAEVASAGRGVKGMQRR